MYIELALFRTFLMSKKVSSVPAPKRGKTDQIDEEPLPEEGNDVFNARGFKYEGEWKRIDGVIKRHGHGVLTSDDFLYEGNFVEDLFDGQGILTFQDGRKYQGHFEKGVISGEGEMTFADQSRYIGEWYNGQMHGIGTFYTVMGDRWTGNWCHGMSTCPIFPQPKPHQDEEEEEEEVAENMQ